MIDYVFGFTYGLSFLLGVYWAGYLWPDCFKRKVYVPHVDIKWYEIDAYPMPAPITGEIYWKQSDGYLVITDGEKIYEVCSLNYNKKGQLITNSYEKKIVTHWARIVPPKVDPSKNSLNEKLTEKRRKLLNQTERK